MYGYIIGADKLASVPETKIRVSKHGKAFRERDSDSMEENLQTWPRMNLHKGDAFGCWAVLFSIT
ncbi:predicted protein [Sclerotinia sclerotiorum 1980 UF-70]|uniref:Uncharacterized protein n=1 Tax=Sclerotinia sclerotiorum (strain ATCC 18683 / 1980 / Ss-1) TaxID=665079 RepID=A7F0V3_SCLS1|nr:predicted protein [Sclerotinia sclerotiorum 1980 UF-70]EDN95345.1 predicted protein [Sclerotinia sclerotiorum 1980 UF-70]